MTIDNIALVADDEDPVGPPMYDGSLTVRAASEVEQKNIAWLWPNRIALGKLTGIAGPPDQGKSQVAISVAAIVSKGGAWPDGGRAPLGSVVILSAEDDPADTTVPRLSAAGADLSRVHLVDALVASAGGHRMFSMKQHLADLAGLVVAIPDLRLIIIDPISAYMGVGTVDTFKSSDVRGVLAPLAVLAAEAGVAILFISHFNKGSSNKSVNRVLDSIAFTAVARSFWAVIPEQGGGSETGRRLLVRIKQNIAAKVSGIAFDIEEVTTDEGVTTSRIRWQEPVEMTADEVLARQQAYASAPRRDDAASFLASTLKEGPVESSKLSQMAEEHGISVATLRRAKAGAEVRNFKKGAIWFVEAAKKHVAQ